MSDKEMAKAFADKAAEINALQEKLSKALGEASMMLSTMGIATKVLGKDAEVTVSPVPEPTREQLHDAAKALLGTSGGKECLKQIMAQYGAKKLSEVPDASLSDFYTEVKSATEIPF